ncbi:MAG: hypothetical protein WCK90_00030 [archaeon]
MKKSVFALVFLVLLLGMVSADIVGQDADVVPLDTTSAGTSASPTLGFRDGSNKVMSYDLQVPESLRVISAIFFGLNNYDMKLSMFVILVCLWAMAIVLIKVLAQLIFNKNGLVWLLSFLITSLIGMTGGFLTAAETLFDLGRFVTFLQQYDLFNLILILVVIVLAFMIILNLTSFAKQTAEKEEAMAEGTERGISSGIMRRMMQSLSGESK